MNTFRRRLAPVVAACFATLCPVATATPLLSLAGQETTLRDKLDSASSLILIVREESELPEAQRLLTMAYAQGQAALILVELPDSALQTAAIQRAAKRFFRSELSRNTVHFMDRKESPYSGLKTILLAPERSEPLFQSSAFPKTLPPPAS
ncbi:hypothetical protein [Pelagicoccus sp. SDUM812003]|uniref:hypothetical protein n=1 Tax=Pelagicoccus sp. SDUM812003 TaxID=3041267 RepID=UPI00280E7D0E|nr:hypothetical protein [Pelagicoccus sp. SDUM812003]MDQ8203422.1 hypothetical protein [Pelagicoccus sp. SDUM812003]